METCTTDEQRRTEMLLEHKNAIVYGGGGSVGGAILD
jgi:FlaA1/EpsC-like NDP-sugar epimerase